MTDAGGISVRAASAHDHRYILDLGASEFEAYGDYAEILGEWLAYSGTVSSIAEGDRRPVGFAIVAPRRSIGFRRRVTAELVAIVVGPSHRGVGVGRALLDRCEALARGWQATEVRLHTAEENHRARTFFRAAGFGDSGARGASYPRGQPALELIKKLT